ncbi:hypothetical protein E3U23_03500 [Erythrobacter litoralis]|uniref:hypothetical protein n=1 Tax=Erythrobacter litoralis TaxID=39960 RepID=UPI002434CCA7|nr:hypothetical protein [Erythrobacter litoralis]MDG6078253.1 hypothetical protein [Erythrobacter litoralis]
MRFTFAMVAACALAACSQEPAAEQEGADDFAARIGGGEQSGAPESSQRRMDLPNTAETAPPQGADVTQLQQLGDIANVNLGPREGGCTFMEGSREMLIAAGLRDGSIPGKAVIRVGDGLTLLDSGPGGLDSIKNGTTFTGEGVTVSVQPTGAAGQSRRARITVADAAGTRKSYSGNWICA